jgi:hypothetical protein
MSQITKFEVDSYEISIDQRGPSPAWVEISISYKRGEHIANMMLHEDEAYKFFEHLGNMKKWVKHTSINEEDK